MNLPIEPSEATTRILETLLLLMVIFITRKVLVRWVTQRNEDHEQIYAWRKGIEYVAFISFFVFLILIWFDRFQNASTYLGLLSAGIAIALQDPIINFVGWLFILSRRPFEVGDRIEIDGVAGDVIDIHLLKFSLLEIGNWVDAEQSTGRIVHVPNRKVFQHHIASYTSGTSFIWNEIPITLTFESDWQLAKRLLHEITERHSLCPTCEQETVFRKEAKKNNIRYQKLTPIVYTKVSDSGVVLTLRYLCLPKKRRTSEQSIWEEVLLLFAEQAELDFAYRTQRVFYHPIEGKTLLTDHSEVAHPRNHLVERVG